MPRFTRSVLVACAILVALTACASSGDSVYSGRFSPSSPIRLTNQTIQGGEYSVGYSMDVLFVPQRNAVTLTCTIIDTSGTIVGFDELSRTITEGGWTHLEARDSYDLPDLTLGIRCSPGSRQLLTASFRDVKLTLEKTG